MDTTDGEATSEVSEVFFDVVEQAEEAMRKIKIFTDSDDREIETQVNKWLAGYVSAVIFRVTQSECSVDGAWSLTLTIFYYEGRGK